LGTALAGLGGALQLPREPASLELDLSVLGSAFVVVVVGGLGSLSGAFVAAILVSLIKATCIWLGVVTIFGIDFAFPKLTLVAEFLVMAAVLIWRPWGLFGRPQPRAMHTLPEPSLTSPQGWQRLSSLLIVLLLFALPVIDQWLPYALILAIDILIAILFAASLHFIMGPGGLHSLVTRLILVWGPMVRAYL